MKWAWTTLALACVPHTAHADDWPFYKANAARDGFTQQTLPAKLAVRWVSNSRHKPMPAWPVSTRLAFDRAHQPVISNGVLYYGSTVDCQIHAVDAATGEKRWSFFTGAPVRFAPALWKDRAAAGGVIVAPSVLAVPLGGRTPAPVVRLASMKRFDVCLETVVQLINRVIASESTFDLVQR